MTDHRLCGWTMKQLLENVTKADQPRAAIRDEVARRIAPSDTEREERFGLVYKQLRLGGYAEMDSIRDELRRRALETRESVDRAEEQQA